MKKVSLYIIITLILISCIHKKENRIISDLIVPKDFNWHSIEEVNIILPSTSTIINQDGDTLAHAIPAGEYNLFLSKNSSYSVVPEATTPLTKAIGGGVIKETIYFPAKNRYATIMFEDLFPSKGDMDMNDVVFGFNLELYLDNQSRLRSFRINIQPRATGSSYRNIGIAAALYSGMSSNYVNRIFHSTNGYISDLFNVTTGSNNSYSTEIGAGFDVIPLTGNFRNHFSNNSELFINVRNIDPPSDTESFWVEVELLSNRIFPISQFTLLQAPSLGRVNLDIFSVFGQRGKEVHFKNGRATNLFHFPFFIASQTNNFSTVDNWVWAILSDKSVRHPQEFVKIYNAYPPFKTWAESGGSSANEWHSVSVLDSLYSAKDFNYIN